MEYANEEEARRAIAELDGRQLRGRPVTVEPMGQDSGRRPPPRRREDGAAANKIFVTNMSPGTTPKTLGELCHEHVGGVRYATVFHTPDGASRGSGKVEFESEDLAVRAVHDLDGKPLDGNQISVQLFSEVTQRDRLDGRYVFVGGLSRDIDEGALWEFVAPMGGATFVKIFLDRDGRSRGCGKIEFETPDAASKAIRELNGKELRGRPVTVEPLGQEVGLRQPPHAARKAPPPIDGRQVFVGGLHPSVDSAALRSFAEEAGKVVFATLFVDRESGQPRGTGKVEFETEEEAQKAVKSLDGKKLMNLSVNVRLMTQEQAPRTRAAPRASNAVAEGRCVLVTGLSPQTSADRFRDFFSQAGHAAYAAVFLDKESGKPKGGGKVEFAKASDANKAVLELNGATLDGRVLTVRMMGHDNPKPALGEGRMVLISGLGPNMDADALGEFLMPHGKVLHAHVMVDRETGHRRGVGRAEFESAEGAKQAVQAVEGFWHDGRKLSARIMTEDRDGAGDRSAKAREAFEKAAPEQRLFIGGLPTSAMSSQLFNLLSQAGTVEFASVHLSSQGIMVGRAVMSSAVEAQRAISVLHDTFVMDKRIIVRLDAPPGERGGVKPNLDAMIFVGGMAFSTAELALRNHFAAVGDVLHATVFIDKETGRSRGSGKVEFATADMAKRAVEALDGSELEGRRLQVKLMEAKPPMSSSGGSTSSRAVPREPPDGRQVLVGGLAGGVNRDQLRQFFESKIGSVIRAQVFVDKDTGISKGSGRVEFETVEAADRAIAELEGAEFSGQAISLRRPGPPGTGGSDRPQADGRTVFVGGLCWDAGTEDLKLFASQVGEVTYASVFVDRETGKSKGSGKVQFATTALANQAVQELSGKHLLGREVTVRLMEARPE